MAPITALGTFTKTFSSVFGNKRIWMGTVVIGDAIGSTWPTAGIPLVASQVGMEAIETAIFNGGTLVYSYDSATATVHAYTGAATTGADKVMVVATAAVPVSDTINLLVIGTGGSNS